MKDIPSFRPSLSFFCALLSLSSIIVLSLYNTHNISNNVLLSRTSLQVLKIIQAAGAISSPTYYYNYLQPSSDDTAGTTTNIQLPGILPNNDNNNFSSVFPTNSTLASQSPPPAPIIHNTRAPAALGGPTLNDPNLKVEQILTGLKLPTSMAFLAPNDILVLEKDIGIVHRIVNGKMLPKPVLQVPVATDGERGLLGIAIALRMVL